jgi:hypothetical protein
MNRTSRIAVGSAVIGTVLFGGTAVASAQGDPSSTAPAPPSGSVTITLSQEQVGFLCDKRLPRIEKRTKKLVDRINGDANTRGSAAWLRARAKHERDAGRDAAAQLLEERADRRAGHVDELNKINKWATDFSGKYCGSK